MEGLRGSGFELARFQVEGASGGLGLEFEFGVRLPEALNQIFLWSL